MARPNTKIIIPGIVIILIIAFGVYYLGGIKNKIQPQNLVVAAQTTPTQPSSTPNETANWKTYTNNLAGYTLGYPSDLLMLQDLTNMGVGVDQKILNSVVVLSTESLPNNNKISGQGIYVRVWNNPSGVALNTFINENILTFVSTEGKSTIKFIPTEVNGIAGLKTSDMPGQVKSDTVLVAHNSSIYEIQWIQTSGKQIPNTIFNQILSTFKFTDQTQTTDVSNWKTYTNSQISLTFQYPQSWNIQELKDNGAVSGVEINGSEGMVHAAWGSGFGGGCDAADHMNFQIFGSSQNICHGIVDGSENWNQIYKQLSKTVTFGMYAKANSPYQSNHNIVLKILSTFKFQ